MNRFLLNPVWVGFLIAASRGRTTGAGLLEEATNLSYPGGGTWGEERPSADEHTSLGSPWKMDRLQSSADGKLWYQAGPSSMWPVFLPHPVWQPEEEAGHVVCATWREAKQKSRYRQLNTTAVEPPNMRRTQHRGKTALSGPPRTLDPLLSPRPLNSQTFILIRTFQVCSLLQGWVNRIHTCTCVHTHIHVHTWRGLYKLINKMERMHPLNTEERASF